MRLIGAGRGLAERRRDQPDAADREHRGGENVETFVHTNLRPFGLTNEAGLRVLVENDGEPKRLLLPLRARIPRRTFPADHRDPTRGIGHSQTLRLAGVRFSRIH